MIILHIHRCILVWLTYGKFPYHFPDLQSSVVFTIFAQVTVMSSWWEVMETNRFLLGG
uniref:Uncharacterized protein n=1 Tax=Arundo donax TaxID=35708 RepID=A0A0A9GS57_ARUDO